MTFSKFSRKASLQSSLLLSHSSRAKRLEELHGSGKKGQAIEEKEVEESSTSGFSSSATGEVSPQEQSIEEHRVNNIQKEYRSGVMEMMKNFNQEKKNITNYMINLSKQSPRMGKMVQPATYQFPRKFFRAIEIG